MIIAPEVAPLVADRKGGKNGTSVKETICHFQGAARSYVSATVLVLIATVNASNFTRLISLSLAVPARSGRSEDGRAGTEEKGKKGGQRDDNFAIQIRDLSDNSSPPPLSRDPVAPE